jgi:uncharacterized protein
MRIILVPLLILACLTSFSQDTANMTIDEKMIASKEFFTGTGGRQRNRPMAISLYLDCARKGNVRAMNMAGYLYANGAGVQTNTTIAKEWLTKAADKGYAESWYHLGMLYKDEKDTVPDYVKAYSCFAKASQMIRLYAGLH